GLVGGFEYNSDLFSRETIRRMTSHFVNLLGSIVDQPTQRIADLSLLTDSERNDCLLRWNQHDVPFADQRCYHELFEAQVQRSPDATAVLFDPCDGQPEKQTSLSYQELNERANQLAHHLIELGVGPENVVAINLDRSTEMVVAMLAIWKAGAAYLPLDRTYPTERLQFLLEDSGATAVLTESATLPDEFTDGITRIDLDRVDLSPQPTADPAVKLHPDNLAYLIYTSGSAGKPKSVLVPHRGLVNLTEDKIRVCDIRTGDCVLQFFSFNFDGSVPEFVMTLAAGAKLLMAPAEVMVPGAPLRDLLIRNEVTHITLTPSALTAMPKHDFPSLRMVLVGGEAPSKELVETWSAGRRFINAYGPTETTVNASMVQCGGDHPAEPTVRPSANKQLYVLDEQLELSPIGAVGELHIGGVGIARGYHHQPKLTAERFIPNPFPSVKDRPYSESVLYKTGDLACYLPDGRIRILGRIDQQTKIRGFRIELPEVERVLEQHPHVRAGLARVRETPAGEKQLVAYAVPNQDDHDSASDIRAFLAEKLPKFMLPSALVWIDHLPMTENGKLDESALPAPETSAREKTAPRTETEKILAPMFTKALELEEIGTDDNFFDLGGHSLLATKLVSGVMETFDVELTVIDLFDAPSIASIAQRIEHKQQLAHLVNADVSADEEDREEIAF
ncbi:MAG: amino acid adenylation domain-containing protein, partial [Planctomycetota bacterium]